MKNLILVLTLLFVADITNAQNTDRLNSFAVESNYVISFSLSYDRIVSKGEIINMMFGGDYIIGTGSYFGSFWLAPEMTMLILGPKHFIEGGLQYALDITFGDRYTNSTSVMRFGYRFQGHKGMMLRATLNFYDESIDPMNLLSMGIGYSF